MLIERFAYTKMGTLGRLTVGDLSLYTIELPWRGNEHNESCIPPGRHDYQRHETLILGGVVSNSEERYDGTLDEVAVYDRALTEDEIQNHYNAGTGT